MGEQERNLADQNVSGSVADGAIRDEASSVESSIARSQCETDRDDLGESICTLINLARDGCGKSRGELLGKLRSYLSLVAYSNMNSKFQGKFGESDVVQQSIVIAMEKFGDFRGQTEGELLGWANRILRNEILQQQRALLSDKRNLFREKSLEDSGRSESFQIGVADHRLTPKTNAIAREQTLAIENAIGRLPKDYQEIIRLRNSEQLPFAEIGQRMNKSDNAVTKLWFRALVHLRKELEFNDV
jgi:RNA polymerase sigma-70 factor (ECF subfamily)